MKVRIKENKLARTTANFGCTDGMYAMQGKEYEADRRGNTYWVKAPEGTDEYAFSPEDVEEVTTPRSTQEIVIDALVLNYVLKFSDIGHTTLVNLSKVQVELAKLLAQLAKEDKVYTPAQLAAYLIARYVKETQ